MQFQADLLGCEVIRPTITETTALGAAYLAGLGAGIWASPEALAGKWKAGKTFGRTCNCPDIEISRQAWRKAVERTLL